MPQYDAFVSYSHAKDKAIAARLQSVVQRLGKPWYARRALRLFRDDTSLSATPHLWPSIEAALSQSRFLILLASREAAASPWVAKEVEYWLANKPPGTLLLALTDGALAWSAAAGDFDWSAATPLPATLRGRLGAEPKWVDLSAYRDGASLSDAKFTESAADFAAFIKGVAKEDLLSEEVRQQRRALTLAWSMVGMLVALGGAAVWQWRAATIAAQEAREQRDRAEKTLALATQTANGLVFELAQKFKNTVGVPNSLVNQILARAHKLQEQLAAGAEDNLELRRSEASALQEIADALIAHGDSAGALNAAKKAVAIMEGLSSAKPESTEYRRELSTSYNKVGEALVSQGNLSGALKALGAALTICENLSKVDPNNAVWRRDVSVGYGRVGDLQKAQGDFSSAQRSYLKSLSINEALSASDPANADWRRDLVASKQKIGEVQFRKGDRAEAIKTFSAALETAKSLSDSDPSNAVWRTDVSTILIRIGDIQREQGDLAAAQQAYDDSLVVMRALSASDEGNALWRLDLSVNYERMGLVQALQGNSDGASKSYRDALAIREALSAADPKNVGFRRDLVGILVQLSTVESEKERAHLLRARGILKELSEDGRLEPAYAQWPGEIEKLLAALDIPVSQPAQPPAKRKK